MRLPLDNLQTHNRPPKTNTPPTYIYSYLLFLSRSSGKSLGKTSKSWGAKPISPKISCLLGLLEARMRVALALKVGRWERRVVEEEPLLLLLVVLLMARKEEEEMDLPRGTEGW